MPPRKTVHTAKAEGKMEDIEGLIDRTELADKLSVSTDTLLRWSKDGYGPTPVRLGGRVRYRAADVSAFVATLIAVADCPQPAA